MRTSALGNVAVAVMLAMAMVMSAHSQDQAQTAGSEGLTAAPGAATGGTPATYSPEALETLLAPIALYPDAVLAQVLASSTNPQEVLDAGNWLIAHTDLKGKELTDAASAVGFTPPMLAVMQFPSIVDMMCMKMDWTTELGTAFKADEPGVLEAVQRLRKQASDMGNLPSSEQMKVTTEEKNDQQVIVVQPANPQVVYVPQYNPTTVYTTPAPAAAAPATTTTVVHEDDDDDDDDGYSGGEMVATGLLAFGAGILANEVFSDDDDDDYYSPNWGYGGSPYYPPPYYPRYGDGYRPSNNYNRPTNYQRGFNNNNVYVDADGNDYFNKFEGGRNDYRRQPKSPITTARPNRSELGELNRRSQTASRSTASAGTRQQVQGSYAGARQSAATMRPAATSKVPKGTYAGATNPAARQKLNPQTAGSRDRGRTTAAAQPAARPQTASRPSTASRTSAAQRSSPSRSSAFGGSQHQGKSERAASQRGRASMSNKSKPSGNRSSGQKRGGGGSRR